MRSETILKRKKLPKTLEKRRLTIVRYENELHQALRLHTKHDVHQNWQYFEKNATETVKVGKLFDMYETFEKTIYIYIFKCSCIFGHKNYSLKRYCKINVFPFKTRRFNCSSENKSRIYSLPFVSGIFHWYKYCKQSKSLCLKTLFSSIIIIVTLPDKIQKYKRCIPYSLSFW